MIERETGGDRSETNLHGCNLKRCLIRPKKRKIRFSGGALKEVWIVLEELPETGDGFKVFFDDESGKFGLAGHSEPFGYVCNSHDTFLAAFKSM